MSNVNDMYHTCRWCKHFSNGRCIGGFLTSVSNDIIKIYQVAEGGKLSEVIEETLNSMKPRRYLHEAAELLESWGISDKRVREFIKLYDEEIPGFLDFHVKPVLDEKISVLYQGTAEGWIDIKEVEIAEPENFYCCRWE